MQGTEQLTTKRLILRRYRPEDADTLYKNFGSDPAMYEYSGWNPYATLEMAADTVRDFIKSYADPTFYGWAIEYDGRMIGTIGAYDYDAEQNSVEIGMSIERASWGRGFAGEALSCVFEYLTEHEQIRTVTAWCAAENIGSRKALTKAGMHETGIESGALEIGGVLHDKINFEYTMK